MEKKRILRAALAVWLCFSLCAAPLRPVLAVEDDFNDDTYEGSVQDTVVRDIEGAEDTVAPDVESAEDTVAPDVEGAEAAAAQTVEGAEAIAVLADEGEENAGTVTGHVNHAICGLVECNVHEDTYGHTHPTLTDWRPWESEDSLPGFDYFTRYYYLTKDVTVSGSWDMSNYPVHLCLNGHTITFTNVTTERNYLIRFADYQNAFDVCDCQGGGEITTTVQDTSSLNGVLVGGVNTSNQKLPSDCTFNMYGGKISNVGHGVNIGSSSNNSNRFNMYGGEISGNSTDGDGAGVYIDGGTFDAYGGSFYMYGGEISGNTCGGNGAGVYNGGRVYMYEGAKISENTCTGQEGNGAGVYSIVSLYMHGGEISKNTCGGSGAGVYCLDDGYLHLYEGAVIKENTKADGQDSNVYLDECGSRLPDPRIIISSGFETTPPIGVSGTEHYADRAFARNYDKHDYDYSAYFKSEFANYDIKYEKSDKGDRVLRFIGPPSATVTAVHENYITSGCGLQVEVKNYNGVGEPTYVWHYTSTDNTTGGTPIGESSNKFTIPYKETVPPGRYYIYCEIKDESGETVITSNTFVVFVRGYVELAPGGTVTTDEGTEVTRSEDGQTVTIKNGDNTETTMTLPEDKTTGEVKVDVVTGEVIVPEGSTVTNKVEGTDNKTPEVTISKGSGTVTPDGEVIIPGDGAATVGSGDKKSTITGGSGDTKVTPKEDGTVDVSGGGKVKTGDTGPEITIGSKGGTVDENGNVTLPDGGTAVIGGGDGNGTVVTPPEGGAIEPGENGDAVVPAGSKVKSEAGGADSTEIILASGGTVNGGEVTPNGEGEGTPPVVGVDNNGDGTPDVSLELPEGGKITLTETGGAEVPAGTVIQKTGEDGDPVSGGAKIEVSSQSGTVDKDGNLDLTDGGTAVIKNGDGGDSEKAVTVTGGKITPKENSTVDVSAGTTVKTGESGTEITIGDPSKPSGDNIGTVNTDGSVTLPENGAAVIGGSGGGNGGTVVTVSGSETTITPSENGGAVVPVGSKVKSKTGGADSTEIILANGGSVDGGSGEVTPEANDEGKLVVGVDNDGDGKPDTLIALPGTDGDNTDGDKIKLNETGGAEVPQGTVIQKTGEDGNPVSGGAKIEVGSKGGTVDKDGSLDLTKGGEAVIKKGDGESETTTTVTGGEGGSKVTPKEGGNVGISSGTSVKSGDSPEITVGDKGADVTPEGSIEIKKGASVTVGGKDGKPVTTITAPETGTAGENGTTVTPQADGTVAIGKGGTVTSGGVDEDGKPTGAPVTLPEGGIVNPDEGGKITPTDNMIATGEDTDGDGIPDTVIILPEDKPELTPNEDGSISLPDGSKIKAKNGEKDIILTEGGAIKPDGSGVQPNGGLTSPGGDGKPGFTVTPPEGGEVSIGEGGLKVPAGTEIKQEGDNRPVITVGENGGVVDEDGNVTLPVDGSVTVTDGSGADAQNGVTVKTPQGGKVDTGLGSVTAQVVEIGGMTITAPEGDEMVTVDGNGAATAPDGTTVTKGGSVVKVSGDGVTVSKDGVITFPNGGTVKITVDGVTKDQTVAAGGTVNINDLDGGSDSGLGGDSNSGGGSSSGSGSSSSGSVNVAPNVSGGKVSISPSRPTRGQTVTITVTPDAGYRLDSLTVTGSGGKTVELTKVGDGQYTFVMPAGSVTVKPSFVKVDSEDTEVRQRFTDVSDDAWYAEYVEYVAANGLMKGYADGRFGPNDNTTRGQIITVLYRYEQEPETGLSGFSDVGGSMYYAKAVAWGADNGIVKGYGANLFGPEDNITREQLAAILFRFAEFKGRDVSGRADLGSFADNGKISNYARPALEWAVASGLMKGKSNSMLDPNGFATRAEVAAMLMRFIEG